LILCMRKTPFDEKTPERSRQGLIFVVSAN